MLDMQIEKKGTINIKIVGIGGAGGNAIDKMIEEDILGVDYIAINTDAQALSISSAEHKIMLGNDGLGAGADPEVARNYAINQKEEIKNALVGAHLVFIVAGMGGGTGTGASHIVAEVARELNILTIAVVTTPFAFEQKKKLDVSNKAIEELKKLVDTIIVIPNSRISEIVGKNVSIKEAFEKSDEILKTAINAINDVIKSTGFINVDFADVKTILTKKGYAHLGIGRGNGENKKIDAIKNAIYSPLVNKSIKNSTALLINVICSDDLTMDDYNDVTTIISNLVGENSLIIPGLRFDENLKDQIEVVVIATGFSDDNGENILSEFESFSLKKAKENISKKFENTINQQNLKPIDFYNNSGSDITLNNEKNVINSNNDISQKELFSSEKKVDTKNLDFDFNIDNLYDDDLEVPPFLKKR